MDNNIDSKIYSINEIIKKIRLLDKEIDKGFTIIGPISFHIFQIKDRIIYLLGDHHVGWDNDCYQTYEDCQKDDRCCDSTTLINKMIEYCGEQKKYVDVYLEINYLSKEIRDMVIKKRDKIDRIKQEYNKIFAKSSNELRREMASSFNLYGGKFPDKGPLYQFTKENLECLRKKNKCAEYSRFHSIDLRGMALFDYLYNRYLLIGGIISNHLILIVKKHNQTIQDESKKYIYDVFSDGDKLYNIRKTVRATMKRLGMKGFNLNDAEITELKRRLFERNELKIRKQIENITDVDIRKKLEEKYNSYLNDTELLKKLLGQLKELQIIDDKKDIIERIKEANKYINDIIRNLIILGAELMDVYLLARMFRKYSDGSQAERIVVFAGDEHVKVYRDFLTSLNKGESYYPQKKKDGGENKCIHVDNYSSNDIITFFSNSDSE